MRLKCIAPRKGVLIIESFGFFKAKCGDIVEMPDKTKAELIMKQYPNCFVIVPEEKLEAISPKNLENFSEKIKGNKKDKMKVSDDILKEFS